MSGVNSSSADKSGTESYQATIWVSIMFRVVVIKLRIIVTENTGNETGKGDDSQHVSTL
jgi:hypothetical protein